MRKGITVRAFSNSVDFLGDTGFLNSVDDFRRVFAAAREHGLEGVQLYTEIESGFLSLKTDTKVLKEIGRAATESGITLPSLEIAPLQYSVTSDDPAERRRGVEVARRGLEMAAELGSCGILFIPGYVGLPWDKSAAPVNYEDAYHRTAEALSQLGEHAGKLGMAVHLENIWNMFLLSPLEMRSLIDQVGSPHVGVLLDVGNCVQFGFPEQWIKILGPRIREVHLKDFRRAVGTIEGFVPLLSGDVNWPQVMAALREVGYEGFLIPEVFPYASYGDMALDHTAKTLERLLES